MRRSISLQHPCSQSAVYEAIMLFQQLWWVSQSVLTIHDVIQWVIQPVFTKYEAVQWVNQSILAIFGVIQSILPIYEAIILF